VAATFGTKDRCSKRSAVATAKRSKKGGFRQIEVGGLARRPNR
jgi:hypothetical protein